MQVTSWRTGASRSGWAPELAAGPGGPAAAGRRVVWAFYVNDVGEAGLAASGGVVWTFYVNDVGEAGLAAGGGAMRGVYVNEGDETGDSAAV